MIGVWRTELVQAARRLAAARTFTVVAVLTLALGAGALATIYSVAKALFLDPLPYPEADRIVVLGGEMRRDDVQEWPLGVLDLQSVREAGASLLGPVPVAGGRSLNVVLGDDVEHVTGELIGADYFGIFGIQPALGRFFNAAEERLPEPTSVVLSHALWERSFGARADIVGSTLVVNELGFEIVGVAPAGFAGLTDEAALWLPIGSAAALYQPGYLDVREFRWLGGVARLDDGVTIDAASARIETVVRGLEREFPREYEGLHVTLEPLPQALFGDLRQPVAIMLGAAALVLAIACTNLASLLLVRGLARRRETALRRALGASSRRIVGAVVAEVLLLVAAGGALGLLAADYVIRPLIGSAGVNLPSFVAPRVDPGVAALTLCVCLATSLLFGLAPAWLTGRVDPGTTLKESGNATTAGQGRRRMQSALVVLETALAIMLLAGTGLLVRGLASHLRTDLGFDADDVTVMRVTMSGQRYAENEPYIAATRDLLERARAANGVTAAALEGPGYPTYGSFGLHFWNDNAPGGPEDLMTNRHHVSPGYFETLGIRLLGGRDFTAADHGDAGSLIIVSRSVAERVWPGEDPIGRTLRTSRGTETKMTVVGVVDDVRHHGLSTSTFTAPNVYLPIFRFPPRSPASVALLVRAAAPPDALAASLRAALRATDATIPAVEIRPLRDALREQTARNRLLTTLMAGFAMLALLLASVGIYGVVAYSVEQGARELGIRMALGAQAAGILGHVLRRGLAPVLVGVLVGAAGVPVVQRLVASQLFGIEPADPVALSGALAALLGIATVAAFLPALRAARIDPLRTLKNE
jgi:putative ABC transport system permease protein